MISQNRQCVYCVGEGKLDTLSVGRGQVVYRVQEAFTEQAASCVGL